MLLGLGLAALAVPGSARGHDQGRRQAAGRPHRRDRRRAAAGLRAWPPAPPPTTRCGTSSSSLPPLAILAALGLDRALRLLAPRMRMIAQIAIVAGCLLPVIRMVQLHPYEYVYFNDLSGGVPAAAGRYELDYWGTSFAELGRRLEPWLAAHRPPLDPRPVPAKVCGPLEASREILPRSLAAAAARRAGRSRHRDRHLLLRRPARGERDRPGRAPGRGAQPCLPHRPGRGDHQLHHALSAAQTQPPSTM